MTELSERSWKDRFATRLAAWFLLGGIAPEAAHADANAHADDHFPRRGPRTPEQEADVVYELLQET